MCARYWAQLSLDVRQHQKRVREIIAEHRSTHPTKHVSSMNDHIDIAAANLQRSREYYRRTLAPLSFEPIVDIDRSDGRKGTGFGRESKPQFWIGGGSAVVGRLHIAFEAESRAAVDEFYKEALSAGAKSKGEPGLQPRYGDNYYAAFVLDPDGHTIEAVCRRHDSSEAA